MTDRFCKAIARKYDFSPRLHGILSSTPSTPRPVDGGSAHGRPLVARQTHMSPVVDRKSVEYHVSDPEKNEDGAPSVSKGLDLNHYSIVDGVWHYFSMDWSSKCTYLSSSN